MKVRSLLVTALGLLVASTASAQQPNKCPPGSVNLGIPDRDRATQDACQMAVDVFQYIAPQLGLSLVGGNATLGQGGALGGLGHFTVELRANAIAGDLPQIQNFPTPGTNGSQKHVLPTKKQFVGLPTVDAAIGVFKGIPLGLTNVGGVDLLVDASYVPTVSGSSIDVKPNQNLQLGFGVRVGILQESLLVPGVGLSYLRRDLPTTTVTGSSSGMSVKIQDAKVNTNAWRLTVSKSLVLFSLAAGVGRDSYDQSALAQGTVQTSPIGSQQSQQIKLSQTMTRTNYFLDASLNMLLAKIVGEVGQASGGSVGPLVNSFSGGAADKSRLYGSLGVRIGF
jgi:hypothetical protein